MSESLLPLLVAFASGIVLGLLFFVGLFLTLVRLRSKPKSARALIWAMASLVARLAVVLYGLWLVGAGNWRRIIAAAAGLLVARVLVVLWVRRGRGDRQISGGAERWS